MPLILMMQGDMPCRFSVNGPLTWLDRNQVDVGDMFWKRTKTILLLGELGVSWLTLDEMSE